MPRYNVRLLVAVLLACLSCDRGPSADGVEPCDDVTVAAPAADVSVVLIVNDTMRRDRVGAYGGPAKTPRFDAFAADNLLFENAVTQSPWTKPSVATLFTSLYPSQHRVATDPQLRNPLDAERTGPILATDVLSEDFETLAEVMRAAGFRTAAFVSNPWMEKRFGFGQGFEVYDDSFASWDVKGETVSRAGLRWLGEQAPGTKFFLYLHYLDSHMPYGRLSRSELKRRSAELAADHRPLNAAAQTYVRSVPFFADGTSPLDEGYPPTLSLLEMAYDAGITNFDRALGLFLDGFAGHWAFEKTAIIVTSDHGEGLFEHGYGNHGNGLFEDELAIPLAVRFPAARPRRGRIRCLVGLVDFMPTLCSYLGLRCPESMFGVSFLGGADRAGGRRYLVSEGVAKRPKHRAIRNRAYKLLWENGPRRDGRTKADPYSLYDLADDPEERRDLLLPENRSERVERVFRTMSAALPEAVPPYASPDKRYAPVDAGTRERLRALGYSD